MNHTQAAFYCSTQETSGHSLSWVDFDVPADTPLVISVSLYYNFTLGEELCRPLAHFLLTVSDLTSGKVPLTDTCGPDTLPIELPLGRGVKSSVAGVHKPTSPFELAATWQLAALSLAIEGWWQDHTNARAPSITSRLQPQHPNSKDVTPRRQETAKDVCTGNTGLCPPGYISVLGQCQKCSLGSSTYSDSDDVVSLVCDGEWVGMMCVITEL